MARSRTTILTAEQARAVRVPYAITDRIQDAAGARGLTIAEYLRRLQNVADELEDRADDGWIRMILDRHKLPVPKPRRGEAEMEDRCCDECGERCSPIDGLCSLCYENREREQQEAEGDHHE